MIGDGLPGLWHPDEPTLVGLAARIAAGQPNPHFFNYPSLWMYALALCFGAQFLVGRLTGSVASVAAFEAAYFVDPSPWFLTGRVASALLGAATVPLTHRLATRLGAGRLAWLAATCLALAPLHIGSSRLLVTDAPLTFATTLALLGILRYAREPARWPAWRAGLVAGLAVSIKYTAAALAIPLLMAAHAADPARRLRDRIIALVAAAAGFLVGTPFAILAPREFLGGVLAELTHARTGHFGGDPAVVGYVHYLTSVLPEGLGLFALIAALAGVVTLTARAIRAPSAPAPLLATYLLASFVVIGGSKIPFDRYCLPLLPPLLAFAAAFAAVALPAAPRWRALAAPVVAVLLLAGPASRTLDTLLRPDTRVLADAWLAAHVPIQIPIAVELYGSAARPSPAQYAEAIAAMSGAPDLNADERRQLERWRRREGLVRTRPPSRPVFRLLDEAPARMDFDRVPYDAAALDARRVGYVVLSEAMYGRYARAPERAAMPAALYEQLTRQGPPVATFPAHPPPSCRSPWRCA